MATGTSSIDSAILSSFAPSRGSGANWPRGPSTSASAPPRIDRANNYRYAGAVGGGAQVDNKPMYSGDRYKSPSFRPQPGYKGNNPQTGESDRWRAQASIYVPKTGYTEPGYQPRDYIPAWRQQGARTPPQDRRGDSYGAQGGHSRGDYGLTQDRRDNSPPQYNHSSREGVESSTQRSGTQDGYQPQETTSTETEKHTLRPVEHVNNEYERRRAGKVRDKTRSSRGFDESESAILGDEISQPDKKAARRAMRAKKRENREETPKMIPLFLPEYISVPNLAKALKIRLDDFLRQMKQMGFTDMSHDHILNAETAGLIAMEYNYEPIADRSAERDLLPRYVPPSPLKNCTSDFP